MIDRQPAKEDRVDEGEHRAVGADAEREGREGRQREPPILHEPAGGKPKVLQKALHAGPPD